MLINERIQQQHHREKSPEKKLGKQKRLALDVGKGID